MGARYRAGRARRGNYAGPHRTDQAARSARAAFFLELWVCGRAGHLVVFDEVLARECDELFLGGMVHDFVADDALRGLRAMLVHVVPEVRKPLVSTGYEDFGNAVQSVTDLAEELVFCSDAARVLAREVLLFMQLFLHDLIGAELQHLRGMMVNKGNAMRMGHVFTFGWGNVLLAVHRAAAPPVQRPGNKGGFRAARRSFARLNDGVYIPFLISISGREQSFVAVLRI